MSSIRSLASAHSTAGVAQRVLRARMAKKRQHPLDSTPMLSTMSAVDLVQRHNAVTSCPRSDAHRATLIQQELRLVTDVALDIVRKCDVASASLDALGSVVVLAGCAGNMDVLTAVLRKLSDDIRDASVVSPTLVSALATAVRIGVNAAGASKYEASKAVSAGTMVTSGWGVVHKAARHPKPSTATNTRRVIPLPQESKTGANVGTGVGVGAGATPQQARIGSETGPSDKDLTSTRRNVVLKVAATVRTAIERVTTYVQGFQVVSDERHRLLQALCRLVDALVDVVPSAAETTEGATVAWQQAQVDAMRTLLADTVGGDVPAEFAVRCVQGGWDLNTAFTMPIPSRVTSELAGSVRDPRLAARGVKC